MSSYHSEYDSVDLNEKLKNDDSFKLQTHAFSQVQTMKGINTKHGDEWKKDYKMLKELRMR